MDFDFLCAGLLILGFYFFRSVETTSETARSVLAEVEIFSVVNPKTLGSEGERHGGRAQMPST